MAIGNSMSADQATIWFAPVGTIGSALAADANEFTTFVSNFDESGGNRDTESIAHFKGAFVTRRKPREQKELTFDVTLRYGPDATIFGKIEREELISADGAGADFKVGMIAIQVTDGEGNYYWKAYNNVNAVVFDGEFSADEEWKGTLSFNLSVADENGDSNIAEDNDDDIATSLTAWPHTTS